MELGRILVNVLALIFLYSFLILVKYAGFYQKGIVKRLFFFLFLWDMPGGIAAIWKLFGVNHDPITDLLVIE